MNFFDKRIITHFNYELILFILPLIYLSHFLIGEISPMLAHKQIIYFSVSAITFIIVFFFPLRKFIRIIPFLYWLGIILLLLVIIMGTTKLGATRWLQVPLIHLD